MAAIMLVLVLPLKKGIWYDEIFTILISNGLYIDTPFALSVNNGVYAGTPAVLGSSHTASGQMINSLNTAGNVYRSTVLDNGNGFLYNISLHGFSKVFGKGITTYTLFSKVCTIAALIAFFALCSLIFEHSVFISLAIMLLATDTVFLGLSHEIRPYTMGAFWVTTAGLYLYKYVYRQDKAAYLLAISFCATCAVLSQFLSAYLLLVLFGYLIYYKRATLFALKNIPAMLLPVLVLGFYFYQSRTGFLIMGKQNEDKLHDMKEPYTMLRALSQSMKFMAINFKAGYPQFRDKLIVNFLSSAIIIALYAAGKKAVKSATERRNLNFLFLCGLSGTLFLTLLSLKSHHYISFTYKYYSFCQPYSCMFIAYVFYLLYHNSKMSKVMQAGLLALIAIPSAAIFIVSPKLATISEGDHLALLAAIRQDNIRRVEVPQWKDALLINSLLPAGYQIDYDLNTTATQITLEGKPQ